MGETIQGATHNCWKIYDTLTCARSSTLLMGQFHDTGHEATMLVDHVLTTVLANEDAIIITTFVF